jgi:DNA polymerase-3 subunit delta
MKISSARADQFIKGPLLHISAVLIYGPDGGLVRERAQALVKTFSGTLHDPFNNIEFNAARLKEEPAKLFDEASSLSFLGNKRTVYVREALDAQQKSILPILDVPAAGDTLVIIESGNLGPRSKLRLAFEGADNAAAIPCYLDDEKTLSAVIRETLRAENITPSRDALAYLQSHLGNDRRITISELEKIALFKGETGELTLQEAQLCVGDSNEATLDDLVFSAGSGDKHRLGRFLDRAFSEGANSVAILRAFVRHFSRLHYAQAQMNQGARVSEAMKSLRPPIFFKQTSSFERQLGFWNLDKIGIVLQMLAETESQCKSSGKPAELLCRQASLRICALVRNPGASV